MRRFFLYIFITLIVFLCLGLRCFSSQNALKNEWKNVLSMALNDPDQLQSSYLYPAPQVTDAREYKKQFAPWLKYETSFKRDGVTLHGWLRDRKNKPLIIYYGGNNEDVSHELWWMNEQKDFAFLLVNYRGYGLSTGTPSEKDLVDDALFVLDHVLKKTRRKPENVILVGRSLGTGVAVQVAAQRPIGKIILITPYDSIHAVAKRHFWFLPIEQYLKDRWNVMGHALQVTAKTTLLVAGEDEIIPPAHARKLAEQFKGIVNYVEIPLANHANIVTMPAFDTLFKEALKQ